MKYVIRVALCLVMLAVTAPAGLALEQDYYAQSSKLATGKWVKISLRESGIYQITASDISAWGLGSDLSQIHVFGYGGAPLSEIMNGDNYADDLPQVPIVRTGDRILFYGQGPTTWKYFRDEDDINLVLTHMQVQHPYANSGCYFVTNDSRFNDIDIEQAQNLPQGQLQTTYLARLFHEQEIINPGETGRVFLGEDFKSRNSQMFNFTLDGLVSGSEVTAFTSFCGLIANAKGYLGFTCNGTALQGSSRDVINDDDGTSHLHYREAKSKKTFTLDGGVKALEYGVNFSSEGTVSLARLNFITVNYESELALRNGSLTFGLDDASKNVSYRLKECGANTRVWDVTQPFKLLQLNVQAGDGTATFSSAVDGRREFVAFDESGSFPHPESLGEVANQDIHAEATPDMIILAPSAYLDQALRVAQLHEKYDNFRVLVLDHEKVFNEFSSGTQDAMAYRRLCKMFYDRGASSDGHRLGYLLLMGGGSYDNRLVGPNASSLNYPHLLTWQTEFSGTDDDSIVTDDFFGSLDDGSGTDLRTLMSISVGRMIVKSVAEARTVVNKLVNYVTKPMYGSWKNQAMFVADDDNRGDHMTQSKWMIDNMKRNGGGDMVYNYVFIDAFDDVSEGGARTYPAARNRMFSALKEGVLWWNYIGHASTQNWTGEGLLMRSDVETQLFYRHLPVLYAATCEYTRFDNSVLSSGERMFLNANGGVIALLCPARLAWIKQNGELSRRVGQFAFTTDEQGRPKRIGDIMRLAKNATRADDSRLNRFRFFCFGDPAMRLASATYKAKVETINGKPVKSDERPSFKAREQVEFSGSILDGNGDLATDFTGSVISTLFGPEQQVITNGNGEEGAKIEYDERPNRLAINVDTVENGRFTVRVIIPSEVNDEYGNYRPSMINLYAYDSHKGAEAMGSDSTFYIYGYEDEVVNDTIGPAIINFGLNNQAFVNGGDVNESPLVLATFGDESGVNFSSAGLGHNITLTLDGTISYNDLVSYYTPMFATEGTLGSFSYQLNDLAQGPHSLRLRVWDVYNNVSEKTINFNVVKGLAPEIADVYCAANPASVETSFYVKHNRPDAVVSVTIEVYDLMGRLVWNTTQSGRSDMYTSVPVTWDLTDKGGRRVPRGIYVYRATITTDGIKEATKAKKLAVTGDY